MPFGILVVETVDFKVKILRNVPSDTLICSVQILIVIQPLSSTFHAVKGRVSCMPQLEVEFPARGRGFGHRRWCFFLIFEGHESFLWGH